MKHIIILGDGMADHAVHRLGGKTLLEYAATPNMDAIARLGRTGRLITVPDGFLPGSEVANATILGYDMHEVYEGRGPLEAASIGYDMHDDDLALRCNIICLADGVIRNHHGGHLTTEDSEELISLLNERLGSPNVTFVKGIQYRHLLVIRGGNKHIICAPPHDHPNEPWTSLLVRPEEGYEEEAQPTADLINDLIIKSQEVPKLRSTWHADVKAMTRPTASGHGEEAIVPRCSHFSRCILRYSTATSFRLSTSYVASDITPGYITSSSRVPPDLPTQITKVRHVLPSKPSARTTSYSSTWKPATKQDTTATYS